MLSTSYDPAADALYVRLSHEPVARTEELDDWTLVDVDKSGAPVGVEVIHPARQSLSLRIHRESDHMWAEVEELPGCFAGGRTVHELLEALKEAISLYLAPSAEVVPA